MSNKLTGLTRLLRFSWCLSVAHNVTTGPDDVTGRRDRKWIDRGEGGLGIRQANNKNRETAFFINKNRKPDIKIGKTKNRSGYQNRKTGDFECKTEKPISKMTKTGKPKNPMPPSYRKAESLQTSADGNVANTFSEVICSKYLSYNNRKEYTHKLLLTNITFGANQGTGTLSSPRTSPIGNGFISLHLLILMPRM